MSKSHVKHSYAFSGKNKVGEVVYPVSMKSRATGKVAFRVVPPSKGNTLEDSIEVDEARMIDLVKDHNYQVRCSSISAGAKPSLFASVRLKHNPSYVP